jgi:hypothetical protein
MTATDPNNKRVVDTEKLRCTTVWCVNYDEELPVDLHILEEPGECICPECGFPMEEV